MTIYSDYSEEPPDIFEPLPHDLAAQYYDLEMADYVEDFPFFRKFLPGSGRILELGCGSGRLANLVRQNNCSYTGLDLSLPALQNALSPHSTNTVFICADMRKWAFTVRFHAILLPYNTLNLLTSAIDIKRCLTTCRQHLKPDGVLLLQLYIATAERMASEKKTFQFRMLDHPDGGRVIKEIRQGYKKQGKLMEIEERFRIRPSMPGAEKKDYQTFYAIAALPVDAWLALFQEAGFSHEGLYNHARDLTPHTPVDSSLYAVLRPIAA